MNRIVIAALTIGLLLATGCAHNAIVTHNSARVDEFYGDLGITGDGNNITVRRLSRINKISFIGCENTVTVEKGALVNQIEFWGCDNVVNIPETLMVRLTEVGKRNQVIRRQTTLELEPEMESETIYSPSEESAPTPTWSETIIPAEEWSPSTETEEQPVEESLDYLPESEADESVPEREEMQRDQEFEK